MGAKPPKVYNYGYDGKPPVRIASSNLFIDTGKVPVDYMVGAVFNEIGGQEFINSYPADLLSSTLLPIKNLADINERYSPANILPISDGILSTFNKYDIKLDTYIPQEDETSNNYLILKNANVYIDSDFANVVLQFKDLFDDEFVEVEILPYKYLYNS
jgi:hypothetical protein